MLEEGKRKGSAMNIDIAQRLYELRRDHGYSQESLAEALDISRQAISKWERAESAPDMGNLIALADLYGITIDELVRPGEFYAEEARSSEAPSAGATDEAMDQEDAAPNASDSPETVDNAADTSTQPESSQTPEPPSDHKSVHAHGHVYTKSEEPARLKCGLRSFPYPLLIVVLFLFLALVLGMWEYVWLFLTIPFYYWIARIIERDPKYREAHGFPPNQ